MEQIERIRKMEEAMDEAGLALRGLEDALDKYEAAGEPLRELEAYLSGAWREDFEADEAGILPKELKRGVLSEDGLYGLLEDAGELRQRMGELSDRRSFIQLARDRFSERHFASQPIEEEKLRRILEAGRLAPTACNYQPQRVYILRSREALEKAASTGASLCGCPLALLVCYDKATVWRNPGDRLCPDYNAGEQDAAIVAASMMFQAEELGVHSLWIRGFDSADVAEAFDLPSDHMPVMILALGYPGERSHPAHLHGKRKPLEETVREL